MPADVVEKERAVLEELTRNEGKPENAIPKIVEGRLNGFYKENCLLEQGFVKEPKTDDRPARRGSRRRMPPSGASRASRSAR